MLSVLVFLWQCVIGFSFLLERYVTISEDAKSEPSNFLGLSLLPKEPCEIQGIYR